MLSSLLRFLLALLPRKASVGNAAPVTGSSGKIKAGLHQDRTRKINQRPVQRVVRSAELMPRQDDRVMPKDNDVRCKNVQEIKPRESVKHWLADVMRCFSIGDDIRYFPEYKDDTVLASIILGFSVNGHIVYIQDQVNVETVNGESIIVITDDHGRHEIYEVHTFCVMLPNDEKTSGLNYEARAELGTRGQFTRGNHITMMANNGESGSPVIEANVLKIQPMKDGYYAKEQLVFLKVIPDTLKTVDNRQYCRVKSQIPVTLQLAKNDQPHRCLLLDFSEGATRVKSVEEDNFTERLTIGQKVVIHIELPKVNKSFVIGGHVKIKRENSAIISFDNIYKDGSFKTISVIDNLQLKASLLQCLDD